MINNYIKNDEFNISIIPYNLTISTITINCNLGTLLLLENIAKYMIIDENNIIAIKSGKYNIFRCINNFLKDKFKSINKNKQKNFYNQLTMIIKIDENKYINIKLFKNGSIQMTGCKNLNDANIGLNKLINRLKLILYEEKEIKFIDDIKNINITNIKIDLINSNFAINYQINKEYLYNILIKQKVLCRISSIHACINIKHKIIDNNNEIYVSIFIFQTGNIIIIGKQPEYIRKTYIYVVNLLNKYKELIIKKNIWNIYDEDYINNFIKENKSI